MAVSQGHYTIFITLGSFANSKSKISKRINFGLNNEIWTSYDENHIY